MSSSETAPCSEGLVDGAMAPGGTPADPPSEGSSPRLKFSFIVPIRQSEATLGECLSAIFRLRGADFEVLVVDDGCLDGSVGIAKEFPCVILNGVQWGGPALARDLGARKARNEILVYVDSDVVVPEHLLELLLEDFQRDPTLIAVQAVYASPEERLPIPDRYQQSFYRWEYLRVPDGKAAILSTFCVALRREEFLAGPGFDSSIKSPSVEDEELGYWYRRVGRPILLDKRIEVRHVCRRGARGFVRRKTRMGSAQMKSILRSRGQNLPLMLSRASHHSLSHVLSMGLLPAILALGLCLRVGFGVQCAWAISATSAVAALVALNASFWRHEWKRVGLLRFLPVPFMALLDQTFSLFGLCLGLSEYLLVGRKY